jgi:CheY-like chemotaxis protein
LRTLLTSGLTMDLIFMQMPELDGLDTTRRIRARWPDPKGPGITGYASEQDRRECLGAGMNDYLAKPVTVLQYEEALTRAIARH